MNTLKDFVNFKLTHADKTAEAEGYPLKLENCKKHKKMRQLEIYGNSFQDGTPSFDNPIEVQSVGELVTDETDTNYGKYKIPVVQRGKNLCKLAGDVTNCIYNNGVVTQTNADTSSYVIYKLYVTYKDGTTSNLFYRYTYSLGKFHEKITVSKEVSSMVFGLDGSKVDTILPIKPLPIGSYVFSWNILNRVQGSMSWCDMQIEEGDTATEYEPYVEPVTTNIYLDEPLRKTSWGVADYIDFKNKKVHRRLHEYYIDGSQTVQKYSDNICFVLTDTSCEWLYGEKGYCNRFVTNGQGSSSNIPYIGMVNATGSRIQITNFTLIDGVTDADSLKQWFADNPTTFSALRLTTPREEPLDIDLPKLNAKTTIIEVDTSLAPSKIYGKYIKR